jgi:dTDP-4-dehydrorhamnose reductase
MRVLITGVSGQLGTELYNISPYENFGIYFQHVPENRYKNISKVDITNKKQIFTYIEKVRPHWIIHCAAITDVDLCEENKEIAWKTNVIGTKNIIDACSKLNSKLVFISTDYVFDGAKGFYKEEDVPNPINFYGKTKCIGEWLVESLPSFIIVRTSMLFSHRKGKFVKWVLEEAKKGKVYGAIDIYSSPTLALELAECVLKLIENDVTGLYHAAGSERVSRYDLIRKFVTAFGYDVDIVKPITSSELKFKAKRLKDSSLDISKVRSIGIKFSNIDDAIKKLKKMIDTNQ